MATFIALITETQEGDKRIRDSVNRASQFAELAAKFKVTVKGTYWTLGEFDGVLIFEAPNDETAASLLYSLTARGAVRTRTLRAFDADEMSTILEGSTT